MMYFGLMARAQHYFLVYKPYGYLSQFSPADGHEGLGSLGDFPKTVYPVGRLDHDSEGLLLLTNDKALNHQLLNPRFAHPRTYWAQVEGAITPTACDRLAAGVDIKIKGKTHHTLPARASLLDPDPVLPERNPPIRFRKSIPTSWLQLELTEGKNRQVRKMTAAVGFPTLRLVRSSIAGVQLGSMQPGEVVPMPQKTLYRKLGLQLP
mgnify:CR=1 FL=1